ncbi:MAG: dTDP-4-dehydrorhamnose 3,5-epimerase [Deltaproteobacteria bacterium]|nr:dTDP-4-dehydrorhamnose 3,5-epimerase [Deltaproteobacteria bacterium]
MKVKELEIPGILLIEPTVHSDERGFFIETYHAGRYADFGIPDKFVQDNHSRSLKGTLRGLHYQLSSPQGKLVRVTSGEVFDVAVDIRKGSPYFGKWVGVILSAENKHQLYIPEGFAHGFCVTSDSAEFQYKCTDYYAPAEERGIIWSDPDIGIDWTVEKPLVSEKDGRLKRLSDMADDLPVYKG